ncbi:MAG: GAF domain-containing protein [candidate division Zixibacteria bacterium]|nr:GAF domain-containing protein [candidate division Zixibacteria bacterium]
MSKKFLRWLTIILPVGFIILMLVITDLILINQIEYVELIVTVITFSIGATLFSNWVFGQLDERESEIKKRAAQLEALNNAGLSLITELDLRIVLQKVVDLSRELVDARFGALGVLDDGGEHFQQFITSGISDDKRFMIGAPPHGRGLFRSMIEEGKPLLINNIQEQEDAYGFPTNHPVMRSLLSTPIKVKGKLIGNLYLSEKVDPFKPESEALIPFDDEDLRILELFATQAAIAIENARLYRQVQQLAILEERQRFGMDLHDGVIQSIYAVGLMLENIQRRVMKDPESAKLGITDAIRSLNTAISDIRNYILDLRPQHFQGRNIVQGIEELARALRANTFMDVNVTITDVDSGKISPEKTVEILHIAQEALSNVQKHAQASEVVVALKVQNHKLSLEITDNGISIKPEDLQRNRGNGLRNMQDRTDILNGEIVIGPNLHGGTEVKLKVPMSKSD